MNFYLSRLNNISFIEILSALIEQEVHFCQKGKKAWRCSEEIQDWNISRHSHLQKVVPCNYTAFKDVDPESSDMNDIVI